MGKKKRLSPKDQRWVDARKRFRLSNAHIQMARELGMNPKKLGGLAKHGQEPWKAPLPVFIESLYFKRFGKRRPDRVRSTEQVVCETPRPARKPTRIDRWKYDAVRRAILRALEESGGGLSFEELPRHVERLLADRERTELGSITWHTTTVKDDLEGKGEIRRAPDSKPQRLVLA